MHTPPDAERVHGHRRDEAQSHRAQAEAELHVLCALVEVCDTTVRRHLIQYTVAGGPSPTHTEPISPS